MARERVCAARWLVCGARWNVSVRRVLLQCVCAHAACALRRVACVARAQAPASRRRGRHTPGALRRRRCGPRPPRRRLQPRRRDGQRAAIRIESNRIESIIMNSNITKIEHDSQSKSKQPRKGKACEGTTANHSRGATRQSVECQDRHHVAISVSASCIVTLSQRTHAHTLARTRTHARAHARAPKRSQLARPPAHSQRGRRIARAHRWWRWAGGAARRAAAARPAPPAAPPSRRRRRVHRARTRPLASPEATARVGREGSGGGMVRGEGKGWAQTRTRADSDRLSLSLRFRLT